MSVWERNSLKELTVKIGSGSTPTGGGESYKTSGISLIRSQNVLDLSFTEDGLAFIDDSQARALNNVTIQHDDILLNITGDSVARCCMVPDHLLPARVNQHVAIIRSDKTKVSPKFLMYSLIHSKNELLQISEVGATRRALTKGMLENFEVNTPPLQHQKAIAEVLSSLDEKIDLLHRNNRTLEKLAETLFRQWFIEEASDNWEITNIGSHVDVKGGGTPSTSKPEYWNGSIHWTSPRDLSGSTRLFMATTERTITEEGLQKISSGLLPLNTVLMSSRAPIGYLAITKVPVAINQGYIACICNGRLDHHFVYLWLKLNMDVMVNNANGSTFLEIPKRTFRDIELILPPVVKLQDFKQVVSPLFDKIWNNETQINTLESLRDSLLPKLLSGEISVN